jgi:hypothetical protein
MIPPLGSLRPETRHLNLSISMRDVREIMAMVNSGYSLKKLALRYGVALETIEDIVMIEKGWTK